MAEITNSSRTRQNRKKTWAKDIFLGILAAVTTICIAVSVTVLFRQLYYFDIDRLNIPENSGFTRQECIRNYDVLIDYNTLGGEKELQFPDMAMSMQGRIHFEEVKTIFTAAQIIAAAGGLFLTGLLIWRRRTYRWMRVSVIMSAVIAISTLEAVFVDWQWTFVVMHKIFFRNDYWLFNPATDPIIKILPDTFFMHCGMMIVGIVVFINIIFEILYRKKRKTYGTTDF